MNPFIQKRSLPPDNTLATVLTTFSRILVKRIVSTFIPGINPDPATFFFGTFYHPGEASPHSIDMLPIQPNSLLNTTCYSCICVCECMCVACGVFRAKPSVAILHSTRALHQYLVKPYRSLLSLL